MNDLLNSLNHEMAAIVVDVRQSLVRLVNGRHGQGAGTIWHEDGLILTNAHVVTGERRGRPKALNVVLGDGCAFPAQLLAHDSQLDLAALAVNASNLPTIELGNSRKLRSGDWVTALGHPWGVVGATSAGMVIDVGVPPELPRYPGDLIQVGLQLRPGHSGGPLVDGNGRLVGINTMIAGPQVGLAIPLYIVKKFLQEKIGKASQSII
ncbi:MAG: trypsin-like serine protease [Chloroflexi bacterium]|nr:trypsin-like serine protease [Chloroflexota bacterium]